MLLKSKIDAHFAYFNVIYNDWTRNDRWLFHSEAMEDGYIIFGTEYKIIDEVNENIYLDIFNKCKGYRNVGIIGISFKPHSPVVVGSPSVRLINDLVNIGVNVKVYDELDQTFENLNGVCNDIDICVTAQECVDKSDLIVFMHLDKKYAILNIQNKIIIDNWGNF